MKHGDFPVRYVKLPEAIPWFQSNFIGMYNYYPLRLDSHIFPLWDGWPTIPTEYQWIPCSLTTPLAWCLVWFSNTSSSLDHLQDLSSTSVQLLGLKRDDLLRQSYSGRSSTKRKKQKKLPGSMSSFWRSLLRSLWSLPSINPKMDSMRGSTERRKRTISAARCTELRGPPKGVQVDLESWGGLAVNWCIFEEKWWKMHKNADQSWISWDSGRYFKTNYMFYYVSQAALSRCSFLCWERKRIKKL